jgi:CNT family concentrative nucleoside transporter
VAAASPFIGQGESAVLIKPFIPHLTEAEIHQVMSSGFATISGSVLVAYIGMGINPQALVSSCVMSIPASLAASKLRYPETEDTLTSGRVVIPDEETKEADNVLHAFSNGCWLGLIVAGCIMANLLCIIALVALINALLGWFFGFWGVPQLSLEQIFGYVFYPVAFLIGVPRGEIYQVAKLIGIKVIQNEFVAYTALISPAYSGLSVRSQMLATYSLCGFANLGSVATQIGVLGQLAPSRRGDVARMAISSLITGCISTLTSAAVAGMVLTNLENFSITAPASSSS